MNVSTYDIEHELMQVVRRLPATRAAEVLDFAQFLVHRDSAPSNGEERALTDWDRQAQQVDLEQSAYERQHERLLEQYRGQFIAMRHGQVIDHDLDRLALRRRVRQQLGDIPVFFTLVEDESIQTFWMRSPKLVTDET
ncbi:MAG TPA: hypothetical protein VL334_08450 [Anaerolineae bacterium]|nr:hypothetical protein [Anaerolineae bacterium]